MAIQKTEALLLKKRDLRETSLILSFYTRDFGKIHGILKGARGSRARNTTKPLFFSLDNVVFYESKRDIFTISQCEAEKLFLNILKDWDRLSIAYYILELVDMFTEPGEKDEAIFESLLKAITSLDEKKEPRSIARLFEINLLKCIGLWAGSEDKNVSKGAMSTLLCYENESWLTSAKIKLSRDIEKEISTITKEIITNNIHRPLKTLKMIEG
ncbi:MAG: DNA repair protein RecO [Candidatus Omnitrophota bacterium]